MDRLASVRNGQQKWPWHGQHHCIAASAWLLPVQARREPQRGPGNHYRRGLSQPHSVCGEIEMPKLPQRGPGRPSQKRILCIFEVRKKPSGTLFSVFLNDGGAPQSRGARENFSPFSPLDKPVPVLHGIILILVTTYIIYDTTPKSWFQFNAKLFVVVTSMKLCRQYRQLQWHIIPWLWPASAVE